MLQRKGCHGDSALSIEGPSLQNYFTQFLPNLEQTLSRFKDETVSLDQEDRGYSSNSSSKSTQNSVPSTQHALRTTNRADHSFDELSNLVSCLKANNSHSEKLMQIMLDGLKKNGSYSLFVERGLDDCFIPIVEMNNDNKPCLELLIKSCDSDRDPSSQLRDYNMEHMALSKFVVAKLHKYANNQIIAQKQLQARSLKTLTIQPKTEAKVIRRVTQSLVPMSSTPLAEKRRSIPAPARRPIRDEIADFSTRSLPPRSCKSKYKS